MIKPAIRSDLDFRFSGFRVLIQGLGFQAFWVFGFKVLESKNASPTQGFEHVKGYAGSYRPLMRRIIPTKSSGPYGRPLRRRSWVKSVRMICSQLFPMIVANWYSSPCRGVEEPFPTFRINRNRSWGLHPLSSSLPQTARDPREDHTADFWSHWRGSTLHTKR